MTLTNLRKRIGSNIGYVDSSGDILSGKDITSTDIDNWINDRYIDDLFSTLSIQYPEDYMQESKASFYKTSGTVSATSTSTSLVATTSIFNNGMVGDHVYNSTDGDLVEITAYSSATAVTVDSAIDDDWDGDTIYVLGTEFALGGNATDARSIVYVGAKYTTDDTYYKTCNQRNYNDLYKDGSETYSAINPIWYPTSVDVDGVMTTAIGILPEPEENVANGIYIKYIEQPAAMSSDTDVPRLPLGSHSILVFGGTADALRKMRRYDEANQFELLYQKGKMDMIKNYALTRQSHPPRVRPTRRAGRLYNRTI